MIFTCDDVALPFSCDPSINIRVDGFHCAVLSCYQDVRRGESQTWHLGRVIFFLLLLSFLIDAQMCLINKRAAAMNN